MSKRHNRQFWRGMVAEHEESGLTAQAFAEQRELNASTLKWWAGRFRAERRAKPAETASRFVEVAGPELPVAVSETRSWVCVGPGVTVRVGGAVVLTFDELPPAEYVAAVALSYDGVSS